MDREYLLVQGELYLGEPGGDAQVVKLREGRPDGWMFNGTAAGKEGAHLLRAGGPGGAQVLDLAPAQGGFAELVFPEAGAYPVVDHTMRRAEGGAHGLFEVGAR